MINTTIPVFSDFRSQKKNIIHIEIFDTHDDFLQERFLYTVRDYVVNEDGSQYDLPRRNPIAVSYAERDMLKQYVLSQAEFPAEMTESYLNNAIQPYALLNFVRMDRLETGTLIYGLDAHEFEITPKL